MPAVEESALQRASQAKREGGPHFARLSSTKRNYCLPYSPDPCPPPMCWKLRGGDSIVENQLEGLKNDTSYKSTYSITVKNHN